MQIDHRRESAEATTSLTRKSSATAGPPRRVNFSERVKHEELFHKIKSACIAPASLPARENFRSLDTTPFPPTPNVAREARALPR